MECLFQIVTESKRLHGCTVLFSPVSYKPRDVINVHRSSYQLLFLSDITQKRNISTSFIKNPPLYNFTKIRSLYAEFIHAARQKNTHGISNARFRIPFCERAWNIDMALIVNGCISTGLKRIFGNHRLNTSEIKLKHVGILSVSLVPRKILKYQNLWQSIQWEMRCSMRSGTDGQTDMTKLIVAFFSRFF
jgi:hypothetical protein